MLTETVRFYDVVKVRYRNYLSSQVELKLDLNYTAFRFLFDINYSLQYAYLNVSEQMHPIEITWYSSEVRVFRVRLY